MQYEVVIGLEVHIQLRTATKLFCADAASFGAAPNTQAGVVTLAHPGTLPVLNQEAVRMAAMLGLALHSTISPISHFDRKHYLYPDLPKGYQTSQHTHPILVGGYLETPVYAPDRLDEHGNAVNNPKAANPTTEAGTPANRVAIHHVHLEEGRRQIKNDSHEHYSCIDLNRAGTPLLELVTEPVIRSAEEAFAFLTQLRKLVRWLDICDGNMEEGSLRADANVSVKLAGSQTLGTKVEVKNLNSIRNLRRAIEAEASRQVSLLSSGQSVTQETRGYDADRNITLPQRDKEEANDYRYFPCPDLPPFTINQQQIEGWKLQMPVLPQQLAASWVAQLGLPLADALVLTEEKATADYYVQLLQHNPAPKAAANWLIGPIKSYLNEHNLTIEELMLPPHALAQLIDLVQQGAVSFSMAATRLLPALISQPQQAA
ncbi:MAG TPA: Asp-tRNA(Asn)/Glu-tRNA(Gln) amidotransferase subunit GatB, partial [Phnomibacter sp.]|nr:Asp-tRNA(Asn)/Glu-tRNA(Gln) amidotransferase subunit GatB [Phnomibacter sp.]